LAHNFLRHIAVYKARRCDSWFDRKGRPVHGGIRPAGDYLLACAPLASLPIRYGFHAIVYGSWWDWRNFYFGLTLATVSFGSWLAFLLRLAIAGQAPMSPDDPHLLQIVPGFVVWFNSFYLLARWQRRYAGAPPPTCHIFLAGWSNLLAAGTYIILMATISSM
jgi:hypothetical protein